MEFRLLGLFEVSESGRAVELPRGKERALVTLLLLHPNEPVPTDRLVEELWVERPPANAAKTVQVYVSRLRKSIGMARLQTTPAGYVLRVEAGELDSERFERLAGEGRERLDAGKPERAEQLLSDALSLWRGPPLADFRFESFAQAEVRRLEQLRGGVVADRVEARLAQGRAEDVVAELKELIEQNPHWERPRAQLMLALYRSRRQAEALDAYQEARTSLVEELGIEPSRELRELQQAILNQEPVLDLVVPHAREPKSARGVFVGREAELAALIAGLEEALAGRGRLFLLVGEPGIGKSRLADELIDRARARGARVLVGRCWEAGGAPAYWPWVQALRAYIRDCDSEVLREQLGDGAAELPQLFPELHRLIPGLPAPASLASEGARFRLFDAMAGFLKNAAAERPFVLVLDDLHAADEPSLLLLQFVARELAVSRLVIVGAYRDVDPTVRDPLAATLAELAREPVTRRIALAGLTGSDVAEYIALTAGFAPDPAIASEIHAQTEGNPLFVEELARLLIAEGALQGGVVPSRIGIPPGVRDVIGRRLRRLSETSQRVLTFASVLGQEFRLDALARLSELPERALLDPLDEAMAAGVVSDAPGASGQLRFAHSLVRDALYQDLTPARRLQLHAQAGEMLEALYANRFESHLAELAHHFVEAAPVGNVEKAVTYASRAGDRAGELLAFEEAARLYRLALSLTEANDLAGRRRRCELLVVLGDVQARAGDMAAARETLLKAAEIADGIGSGELLARAALGYGGRFVFTRGAEDHRLVPMLEQALARFGEEESPLRVRVLARLASALRSRGSPEPSDSLSAQALEIARRLRDPATLAYAISG